MSIKNIDLVSLRQELESVDPSNILCPIEMEFISIDNGLVENLEPIIKKLTRGKRLLMVSDATKIVSNSKPIKDLIFKTLSKYYSIEWLVLSSDKNERDIHADEQYAYRIKNAIKEVDCVVGVGSGTITDLCKYGLFISKKEIPLLIVQTMLSVNAFSDGVSVLFKNGVKKTVSSMYPTALAIDMDVVTQAPMDKTMAGYGDLLATWTAPADWLLAHKIGMNKHYHDAPFNMMKTQCHKLLLDSSKLKSGDTKAYNLLAEALTLSGLAMGIAGESSPASGSEHTMTHLIDMSSESKGDILAYHGAQVAISSLVSACAWDILLNEFIPEDIVIDNCFPSIENMKKRVFNAFNKLGSNNEISEECWKGYEQKIIKWHDNRENFKTFLAEWSSFKDTIKTMVHTPEYLSKCMTNAGAPKRFKNLTPPIDKHTVKWAILNCHLYRERYTLADFLYYIGWWNNSFIDRIIDRLENLNSGI